ncbi:MAG TPA: hypothetical protein VNN72_15435 [Polyangiaceae bacterium]|nr:hypothetical protein [Polyangiaceae bacterium]
MDALPPPNPPDRGAYVAPASTPAGPRPSVGAARGGFGLGMEGNDGFAGAYYAQLDLWPLQFLGFGVEGVLGGMQAPGFLGPGSKVTHRAARARASLRWSFPAYQRLTKTNPTPHATTRIALSASFGVGPGHYEKTSYRAAPCPETESCDDWNPTHYDAVSSGANVVSESIELAIRFQWRVTEVGIVARCEVFDSHAPITLGPTLGFGF